MIENRFLVRTEHNWLLYLNDAEYFYKTTYLYFVKNNDMLIFNTTFHADDAVHDAYLCFMREEYIPQSMNSGFLLEPRFARIHAQHEQNGTSYSLQFKVKNIETLNLWLSSGGNNLTQIIVSKFGNKVAGFVTVMEEVGF